MSDAAIRHITDFRLALRRGGYAPIPLVGKEPAITGWTKKLDASVEEIGSWRATLPRARNTGIPTRHVPTLDLDIEDPEAADAVEETVRDWFEGRGTMVTRFGNAPRRAFLFQTDAPFSKMTRKFVAPNGDHHQIELLSDGQQIVVGGVHPNTGKHYWWAGDRGPDTVPREELPKLSEQEAAAVLGHITDVLCEQFNYQIATPEPTGHIGNGSVQEYTDADILYANMKYKCGAIGLHNAQLRAIASRMREGIAIPMVVAEALEATKRATADDPRTRGWNWSDTKKGKDVGEEWRLWEMAYSLVNKNPELAYLLPDKLYAAWKEKARPFVMWVAFAGHGRGAWAVMERRNDTTATDDREAVTPPTDGQPRPVTHATPIFVLRPRGLIIPSLIPPREWLGGGRHYQRRTVCLTAAPGDFGKTSLATVEAVSMHTARTCSASSPTRSCGFGTTTARIRSRNWTSASPPFASTTRSRWKKSQTLPSRTRRWCRCGWLPVTAI